MKFECRLFSNTDLVPAAALFKTTFSDAPWHESWTEESALARINHFYMTPAFHGVIAHDENQMMGFLLGNLEPFTNKQVFYLREMCVHPAYQNRGVGKALMYASDKMLIKRACESTYLATDRRFPSQKFYKGLGFQTLPNLDFFQKSYA